MENDHGLCADKTPIIYIYIEESKTIINKYFNKRETIKNIKKF